MPELGDRIYERARLTGEFRLRSGATSSEYFDKYLFESDPRLLREIAEELVGLLPAGVEVLAGLELGGVPLAVAVSQASGLPTVFVRKTAKTYGTCGARRGELRRERKRRAAAHARWRRRQLRPAVRCRLLGDQVHAHRHRHPLRAVWPCALAQSAPATAQPSRIGRHRLSCRHRGETSS